jgi:hypothetical protein
VVISLSLWPSARLSPKPVLLTSYYDDDILPIFLQSPHIILFARESWLTQVYSLLWRVGLCVRGTTVRGWFHKWMRPARPLFPDAYRYFHLAKYREREEEIISFFKATVPLPPVILRSDKRRRRGELLTGPRGPSPITAVKNILSYLEPGCTKIWSIRSNI